MSENTSLRLNADLEEQHLELVREGVEDSFAELKRKRKL